MSLVPSLLRAIVTIDGEALVLHVGDRPYVLASSGQIDLAARSLSHDEVTSAIAQLLPDDARRALQDLGAAQHELADLPEFPGEQFNVVAARGGEDVWVEIRRRLAPPLDRTRAEMRSAPPAAVRDEAGRPKTATHASPPSAPDLRSSVAEPPGVTDSRAVERDDQEGMHGPPGYDDERRDAPGTPARRIIEPAVEHELSAESELTPQSAVVLPLTRTPLRAEVPPPLADQALAGLDRLLRLAAARGASTLFLSSGTRPSIRVDGEVQALESTTILGPNDVESLLLTLMPERNAEALRRGATSEWICDFPDLGRVRCMSFRDHRGPGGVFRIMPTRAVTSQQLGLSPEIQALAAGTQGVVLVAGPRSSGKRTLMSALVDLINRTRRAHIITIEREINVVHERGSSFVSQREAHGGADEMLELARAALREDPDVLVLESVRGAELMTLALDAAASGRLVICGFPAHNATGAVDAIIDLFPPDARRQVQISLAQNLCGIIVQVLLNKAAGGRLAARELLLNTPAVASVIAEGKTSQLPLVIEGGRKHGMVPLNDALAGFVQSGAVDVREAFQRTQDRAGFLATLQRQGIDTSSVERFA
jgi:twitching motility protein PilT